MYVVWLAQAHDKWLVLGANLLILLTLCLSFYLCLRLLLLLFRFLFLFCVQFYFNFSRFLPISARSVCGRACVWFGLRLFLYQFFCMNDVNSALYNQSWFSFIPGAVAITTAAVTAYWLRIKSLPLQPSNRHIDIYIVCMHIYSTAFSEFLINFQARFDDDPEARFLCGC